MKVHELVFPLSEIEIGDIIQVPRNKVMEHGGSDENDMRISVVGWSNGYHGFIITGSAEGKIVQTKNLIDAKGIAIKTWIQHRALYIAAEYLDRSDIFDLRGTLHMPVHILKTFEGIYVVTKNGQILFRDDEIIKIPIETIPSVVINDIRERNPLLPENSIYDDNLKHALENHRSYKESRPCSGIELFNCKETTTLTFFNKWLCVECMKKICAASVYADSYAFRKKNDTKVFVF